MGSLNKILLDNVLNEEDLPHTILGKVVLNLTGQNLKAGRKKF